MLNFVTEINVDLSGSLLQLSKYLEYLRIRMLNNSGVKSETEQDV